MTHIFSSILVWQKKEVVQSSNSRILITIFSSRQKVFTIIDPQRKNNTKILKLNQPKVHKSRKWIFKPPQGHWEMRNFNNKDNERNPKQNENMMKRPLTLDLNKKVAPSNNGPHQILSTPDVNLCNLGSPELEKYILNTDTLQTPTPSGIFPTTAKVMKQLPWSDWWSSLI